MWNISRKMLNSNRMRRIQKRLPMKSMLQQVKKGQLQDGQKKPKARLDNESYIARQDFIMKFIF